MTSGEQLRSQIIAQLIVVDGILNDLYEKDDTFNNETLRDMATRANTGLRAVYDSTTAGPSSISEAVSGAYNKINKTYNALRSRLAEFGITSAPPFYDVVWDAISELPESMTYLGSKVGEAAGKTVGGLAAFSFETLKETITGFFSGFGWFGWLVVGLAAIAATLYFFPGLLGAAKQAVA